MVGFHTSKFLLIFIVVFLKLAVIDREIYLSTARVRLVEIEEIVLNEIDIESQNSTRTD